MEPVLLIVEDFIFFWCVCLEDGIPTRADFLMATMGLGALHDGVRMAFRGDHQRGRAGGSVPNAVEIGVGVNVGGA